MSQNSRWPKEFAVAGAMLFKATSLADSVGCSAWEFAVEISELNAVGLSRIDLRWLVYQGFLEHADELVVATSCTRRFRRTGRLTFSNFTCFVLTPAGCSAVSRLPDDARDSEMPQFMKRNRRSRCSPRKDRTASNFVSLKPLWNPTLNRLFLGDLLVKQYRRPAPNQQLILSAFQEEDWPEHIDDPLPPAAEIEPQRRLHETLAGLNRRQVAPVLRFSGDGRGRGITWIAIPNMA